ncbi:MAG: HDIG domain-containing metalloprotein, partial [Rubripirellula sp.]
VILQKGREAADEVNVSGLHDKVLRMLGRLHFRTSYSQNVLRHSVEVAFISGLVGEMLGMDGDVARRCGLLHDIGKAADHELEGGHPKIGADLLRRHKESPEVVHAALGHHDEIVTEHPYTMLVAIGDACSASRPGARRESLERYVKRMEELESIAERFDGVQQAFAISAGRELRVIVNSEKTTDEQAAAVCHDIAKAFESELTYPGEIKVTVLRESRYVETAR